MGKIFKAAQAGTLESSDIMVTVLPGTDGSGLVIDIDSIVMAQYGKAIRKTLIHTITQQGITDIYVKAVDRGALDCTIRARTLTALARAGAVLKGEIV